MVKKKIGVFISGGGTNLQALIDRMDQINGEIDLIVSNRQDAYGLERGRRNSIDSIFLEAGEDYNRRLLEECRKRGLDLIVLAGYLKILDRNLVAEYRNRIINIHPSLLPSFGGKGCYGENVHQMVYNRGVKVTGATVHFVDEGTDTGPIILQEAVAIREDDSIGDIQKRVLEVEHSLLPKAVKLFCEDRLELEAGRVKILKR